MTEKYKELPSLPGTFDWRLFAHYKDVRAQVHANRGEADGMVHSTAELNTMCKLDGTRNVNVAVLVSLQVHLSLRMPPRPG